MCHKLDLVATMSCRRWVGRWLMNPWNHRVKGRWVGDQLWSHNPWQPILRNKFSCATWRSLHRLLWAGEWKSVASWTWKDFIPLCRLQSAWRRHSKSPTACGHTSNTASQTIVGLAWSKRPRWSVLPVVPDNGPVGHSWKPLLARQPYWQNKGSPDLRSQHNGNPAALETAKIYKLVSAVQTENSDDFFITSWKGLEEQKIILMTFINIYKTCI